MNDNVSRVYSKMRPVTDHHKVVCLVTAFIGFSFQFVGVASKWGAMGRPFWDYDVYAFAIQRYSQGLNPYTINSDGFSFVYPPAFLHLFPKTYFSEFYIAFLFIIITLAGVALFRLRSFASFALLGFLTGGSGFVAVLSGNLTVFAHIFLVSIAYAVFKNNKSQSILHLYAFAVLSFSIIKVYFITYLLILVLLPKPRTLAFCFYTMCFIAAFVVQAVFDATLWNEFRISLYNSTLVTGDVGYTSFLIIQKLFGSAIGGLALHGFLLVGIFALMLRGQPKGSKYRKHISSEGELFYVLAIIIALNPRMKEYDICVFMGCLYLSLASAQRSRGGIGIVFTYVIPLLAIVAMATGKTLYLFGYYKIFDYYIYVSLLTVSYLLVIYIGLFDATFRLHPFVDRPTIRREPATIDE